MNKEIKTWFQEWGEWFYQWCFLWLANSEYVCCYFCFSCTWMCSPLSIRGSPEQKQFDFHLFSKYFEPIWIHIYTYVSEPCRWICHNFCFQLYLSETAWNNWWLKWYFSLSVYKKSVKKTITVVRIQKYATCTYRIKQPKAELIK